MQQGRYHNGQGWLEYALIFILLVLVIMVLYRLFGPSLSEWINDLRITPTPLPGTVTPEAYHLQMNF